MNSLITIKKVGVSYAMQPHVLKDCNATIEGPTITGIIGPNGAGTVSYTHLTLPTKA